MKALCDAHGIRYYHFLQPNQYLPGSKPMGKQERAVAIDSETPYRPPVIRGYPELIRGGGRLKSLGVRFRDLSGVFRTHPEPLYTDDCCHYSAAGSLIVEREIASYILRDFQGLRR
jgi:hypothetical protein